MTYHPKKVLVTGGAGFIGANHIRFLLVQDPQVEVINLDALTYAANPVYLADLPTERYKLVQGDIRDAALVSQLLSANQIDTVIHFAAESHVDRSISGPMAFVQTNLMGTATLLECARTYWQQQQWDAMQCRFHHISTDEVFGSLQPTDPAFSETTAYAPNSPYSASKAGSDHLVRAWYHTFGLPVTMSNCSNNYGPFQHDEKFIPTIIRSCVQQQPIPVYGNGSNIRDWLYVEDHCRAVDCIIRHGRVGESYNIGGNNEYANLDIVQTICKLMDQRFPARAPHQQLIQFITDRAGHDWRYAIDPTKTGKELGWKPQETFASGIEKTLGWYLALYQ